MADNAIQIALQTVDNMSSGLAAAESRVRDFAANLNTAFGSIVAGSAALAAVSIAAGGLALKAADTVEQLQNLSTATGVSAENLQVLQFAFKQGGVDAESLNVGLMFMTRAMQTNADKLKAMGVTSRDTFTAFQQLAAHLAKVSDVGQRNAEMFEVFGRGGARLAPILLQISNNFGAVADEATKTGNVFNSTELQKFANLDQNVDRLNASLDGLKNRLASTFSGPTAAFVESINKMFEYWSTQPVIEADANRKSAIGIAMLRKLGYTPGPGDFGNDSFGFNDGLTGPMAQPGPTAQQLFMQNLQNNSYLQGFEGDRLGLRGGGQGSGGLQISGLADEVGTQLTEAGKKALEFQETWVRAFDTIGRSVNGGFFTVLTNLTNKTQTFASAMKTIWQGIAQGILQAMAEVLASAITKAFLKLLAIAVSALFGGGTAAAVGSFMEGVASVTPGSIPGGAVPMSTSGGGTTYVIQSINMKDGLRNISSPTGSLRSANTRIAEVAAAS